RRHPPGGSGTPSGGPIMSRVRVGPSYPQVRERRRCTRRLRPATLRLRLEYLEDRCLLSTGLGTLSPPPAHFSPTYVLHHRAGDVGPLATSSPTGYTPSQIRHAYG